GAVATTDEVYNAIVDGAPGGIELFHGYTYSGHPLAAAAAIATIDVHRAENLAGRAAAMEEYFGNAVHALRDLPNVIDIRNIGMMAAIELAPREGKPDRKSTRLNSSHITSSY